MPGCRPFLAAAALSAGLLLPFRAVPQAQESGEDIFRKTRAVYADLKSYEDTGLYVFEYGTDSMDKKPFATRFRRAPRGFVLDFDPQSATRFVVWGDPEAFHTWWKTTGGQYDYPNPNNAPALASPRQTGSTALKIPTLLYAKASLLSDFSNLTDLVSDGSEAVNGHKCYRLMGITRDVYAATGKEVNARKMTIWIDAESLMIRKVLEEWKPLPGQRSRCTTIYEPRANVAIDESKFAFTPPEGKRP